MKYSYNDIMVVPATISYISSRSQCNPYTTYNYLPIFTAPMASVVSEDNYNVFQENKIYPIIPRNIPFLSRLNLLNGGVWCAFSLSEAESLYGYELNDNSKILIDIANGHMKKLYDIAKELKSKCKTYQVMVGNIANPNTYEYVSRNYYEYVDYIRVGIGGGNGCITSSNTGIHYPIASLIKECKQIKDTIGGPKIIADGGIRNYSDIIKALALGADYVMVGSLFAQCIESAGDKYSMNQLNKIDMRFNYNTWEEDSLRINENGEWFGHIKELKDEKYIGQLNVKFFGMASADGQKSILGEKSKTSEGITKWLPVKYNLSSWRENMEDYLKSAMSYLNVKDLSGLSKAEIVIISDNTKNSINK